MKRERDHRERKRIIEKRKIGRKGISRGEQRMEGMRSMDARRDKKNE